ncbi:MAG: serine protease [Myxococcota bacterium]|jgi:serine protease
MLAWLVTAAVAVAASPHRAPALRQLDLYDGPGRRADTLTIKLAEDAGVRWEDGALVGLDAALMAPLLGAAPLFTRPAAALRADRATFDPEHQLADLSLYVTVRATDAAALGAVLQGHAQIECAYLAFGPVPPPADIPPTTPDFEDLQEYRGPAPAGLGFDEAARWPGGDGSNVAIADIEYGWEPEHEDLEAVADEVAWGWASGLYEFHGTAVLGELVATDDGYGVTGMATGADVFVVSPFSEPDVYSVAAAIDGAASLLDAGDVLLIEQQAYVYGVFAPVSVEPAVFDAIAAATAKGIVVVEPGGNGAQDLDDPLWEGWFDREQRDSGAIMVGGGASPLGGYTARDWYPYGSSYGTRVDVQGWYDSIVTTAGPSMANLFDAGDGLQGYTDYFGGTSGASPMIAAAAAVANSIAWEVWGQPWDPWDLRAALTSTGTPQDDQSGAHIGPQPDLRRLLWAWGAR